MEKRADKQRGLLQKAKVADDLPLHLLGSRDDLAANPVVLQIVPDVLVGIQLGRIGRKEEQPEFALNALQEAAHLHRLMGRMSVHDQEDRSSHALKHPLQRESRHLP